MTCAAHRDAILDLARGVPMPAAIARAAEAHLSGCPSCEGELRRQRALTSALAVLASDPEGLPNAADLEARLVKRLVVEPAVASAGTSRPRDGARLAMAAAAVVLLLVGLWNWPLHRQRPEGATAGNAGAAERRPDAVLESPTPARPPAMTRAGEPAAPAAAAPNVTRRSRGHGRPVRAVSTVEFMTIPAAAGLPALESARIVRMQLPVAALPAYGVAMIPDASRTAVEADLLVGQDGQPRAIRLVSSRPASDTSRSRP